MKEDEIQFAIEILSRITAQRQDTKRLNLIQHIHNSLSHPPSKKEISELIEINQELISLLKHEQMEILYPFSKNKNAAKAFGKAFLEGYYEWSKLSDDPYELLKMIERMLGDLEASEAYLNKNLVEKAPSGASNIQSRQKKRRSF
jgi:hypothetical protein